MNMKLNKTFSLKPLAIIVCIILLYFGRKQIENIELRSHFYGVKCNFGQGLTKFQQSESEMLKKKDSMLNIKQYNNESVNFIVEKSSLFFFKLISLHFVKGGEVKQGAAMNILV